MSGRVILITGLMAAGKSTVAQALAERLPKSVHLRGDTFRKMIVNGEAEMHGVELSADAREQLFLRYELARMVAQRYAEAGWTVVYQDIILGDALAATVDAFGETPLQVIVLAPNPEAVIEREAGRPKTGYADAADIRSFDRVLRQETPRVGWWVDTTDMSAAETVDAILRQIDVLE